MSMRPAVRHAVPVMAILCAVGVFTVPGADQPDTSVASAALTGTWSSDGYGFVFVADGDTLQAYEVTQTTCVKSLMATRRADAVPGVEAVYGQDDDVLLVKPTP